MKQLATIFTYRFFDFDNNVVRIGGIETYTLDLSLLLVKMGYETTVYTAIDATTEYNECIYKGFKIKEIEKGKSFDICFAALYRRLFDTQKRYVQPYLVNRRVQANLSYGNTLLYDAYLRSIQQH